MAGAGECHSSPFEAFIEEADRAYRHAERELEEVELLIRQTTEEVEQLATRNTRATNQLRQVEASIETVPRGDIEEAYTTVLDTQQRLFTMRGQLEKLQADRDNTTRYQELLRGILEHAAELESRRPDGEEEDGSAQVSVVRIIEAQEQERRRLSRQMHDGPAQSLTNLILQAEICQRLLDSDPERARVELGTLKESVATTFRTVRGFILDLRPMMLDDLGLVPTLRQYLESLSESSNLETELTVIGKERRMASHHEVTTFRIIQELLKTAREHGRARSARIELEMEADNLRVTFDDDGEGLEVAHDLTSEEAERLGLTTMRERIEMLGGEVDFDSAPGKGMRVRFDLPLA